MAEINGKGQVSTEKQAQEEVSASRQNFRKELNEKLEALFEAIKFDDNHPSVDPTSGPNLKGFEVLKVDKQTFVENGVNKDICEALFDSLSDFYNVGGPPVAKSHGNFLIVVGRFNTGIHLTIRNQHSDDDDPAIEFALSEDNHLTLASTIEGDKPFIITKPPYKPVNLDQERKDCFAVIKTITALAKQTGFIKG